MTSEMNSTVTAAYWDYDPSEYNGSEVEDEEVLLCDRTGDNDLGARLSHLYFLMFLISLLGNSLVLVIIYRFEKLTTVTNIFLLNLVVSDLIFMSSLPFWAVYHQMTSWVFGRVMCKLVSSAYFLGFYSSVLFLALMTFDRHLAVVYSLTPRLRRRSYAVVSCAAVWLLSGLACVRPMLLYTTYVHMGALFCEEHPGERMAEHPAVDLTALRAAGKFLQLGLFFLFPLGVIVYCYVRISITVLSSMMVSKLRTVRLILIIVLLFFVCWTPYNVVLLLLDSATSCREVQTLGYSLQVTRNMAYLYFCVSPVFYTFVGKKFQRHFRHLVARRVPAWLRRGRGQGRRAPSSSAVSRSSRSTARSDTTQCSTGASTAAFTLLPTARDTSPSGSTTAFTPLATARDTSPSGSTAAFTLLPTARDTSPSGSTTAFTPLATARDTSPSGSTAAFTLQATAEDAKLQSDAAF